MRRRQPDLVKPESDHILFAMAQLNVPTGRDLRRETDAVKRLATEDRRHRPLVRGGHQDGTALKELIRTLAKAGIIADGTRIGLTLPILVGDYMVHSSAAQTGSDIASTTDTVNYSTAMQLDILLPVGTWNVNVLGGLQLIHSASLTAAFRVEIGANVGTGRTTGNLSSTVYTMHVDNHRIGSIAGNAITSIFVKYRSNGAGTTSARNPWAVLTAVREDAY